MAKRPDYYWDTPEERAKYPNYDNFHEYMLTPESMERLLKETFAPNPELEKMYEGYSFDPISDEDDEDEEVGEEPQDVNGPNEPNA